jgi:hypothetical protein
VLLLLLLLTPPTTSHPMPLRPTPQRTKGRFPHLFFRETPADHPKDMAKKICLPFGGERPCYCYCHH